MAFGWYRLAKGKLIRKLREKEKLDCRLAITPYLQAEADLEYLILYKFSFINRRNTLLNLEKELMKDVPGWIPGQSVYHQNERWMPPTQPL